MKRLIVLALVALLLTGCGGVWMNPRYSAQLDAYVTISAKHAADANAGRMDPNEMADALDAYAETFKLWQDARRNRESDGAK